MEHVVKDVGQELFNLEVKLCFIIENIRKRLVVVLWPKFRRQKLTSVIWSRNFCSKGISVGIM